MPGRASSRPADDLANRRDRELELLVRGEEVRAEPQADVRTVVTDDLALFELRVDGRGVGHADDDRPAAALGLARADDLEPGLVEQAHEQLGLPHGVVADPVDADLLDDVVARRRRVERRHVRCAGQEAPRACRVLELGLEAERPRVRLPADERRLERLGQVGADVEPAGARAAAQPLDAPADREVDVQRGHVERHGADRLVGVEHDVRADLVRPLDDRLDVLDAPRLEDHVADRDEQGPLVDRRDDRLLVPADDDLGAARLLRLLEVADGREVLLLVHDPPPLAAQVEAREDDRLGDRHVLVHDRRAGRRADETPDLVADGDRQLPPAFAPGPHAARVPRLRVPGQAARGLGGHRSQRVADQVRRLREDREALAVLGQLHGANRTTRTGARGGRSADSRASPARSPRARRRTPPRSRTR